MSRSYSELVDILAVSQEPTARGPRYEAFCRAVARLQIPLSGSGVFLIAGTNGKGTTAATLAALIGGNVGLFTSPHLMEPTERIRTAGRDLSPDEFVQAYSLVEDVVREFDLSHFEILTLMMIETFFGGRVRPRVDRAVIEVGVGGRLDPTRAVPHETAVIARIGRDHEAMLGHTLDAIAREKLAIAEGARRCVYLAPGPVEAPAFAEARAKYAGCEFIEARIFDARITEAHVTKEPRWTLKTPWGEAPLALAGDRAVQNTSLALEALNATGARPDVTRLSSVVWPGRMELVDGVYLSGDHNEQGIESLVELLGNFKYETLHLIIGVGKGKPLAKMISSLRRMPRVKFTLTRTAFRSMDVEELRALGERVIEDPLQAVSQVKSEASARDLVVVTGSLYLVGDIRKALTSRSR